MTLFDEPQAEYHLFDSMRLRFLPVEPRRMTESEREEANEYFIRSLCPNLQWKSGTEQSTRSYTIKR